MINKTNNEKIQVKITTFGGFSVTIEGITVSDTINRSKKMWLLFEYLLLTPDERIPHAKIINTIWADTEMENPTNALKTLLYRLRITMESQHLPHIKELILQKKGSYYRNPDFVYTVDAEEFEKKIKKASASTLDSEKKMKLYASALEKYKGTYLAFSQNESWAIAKSDYYKQLCLNGVLEYSALLLDAENYEALEVVSRLAIPLDEFNETIHYNYMMSLFMLNRKDEALNHYDNTVNLFFSVFGDRPSEKLSDFYKQILQTHDSTEMDLHHIKDQLAKDEQPKGALYCEYEFFKRMYYLMRRFSERSGYSVYLALFTVTDYNNETPPKKELNRTMGQLLHIISSNLRSSDVVSRFSATQFVIMLLMTNFNNGTSIMERTLTSFKRLYPKNTLLIRYKLQPVEPLKSVPNLTKDALPMDDESFDGFDTDELSIMDILSR